MGSSVLHENQPEWRERRLHLGRENPRLVVYYFLSNFSEMTEILCSCDITSFLLWTNQRPHGKDPPARLGPPGCCPVTKTPCQQVRQTWSFISSPALTAKLRPLASDCLLLLPQQHFQSCFRNEQVSTFPSTQTRSSGVCHFDWLLHTRWFQFLPQLSSSTPLSSLSHFK